jgi:hypothetical protein
VERHGLRGFDDNGNVVVATFPEDRSKSRFYRFDIVRMFQEAGLIVPESDYDDWLERHAQAGQIGFDPEPYRLLDEESPLLWLYARFRLWYEGLDR